jgi:cellulose synthase/poly-beta-1,6-N-acetylglucosamine synthase-like glycosyltransferase
VTAGTSARPDVSVVIPVRNGADYVMDACLSALGQVGVGVEVLVVENGSTDDTVARVASLRDDRLRLFRQAQAGVSVARNRGIEEARADWVAFLDADDRWRPEKLRRQLDAAGSADLLFCDCVLVAGDRARESTFLDVNPPPAADAPLLPELLERPNFIPLSSVVVRRSALQSVGGFRPRRSHSEDWDLWVRLALAGCTWSCLAEPLVEYTVNPQGASRDNRSIFAGEVQTLTDAMPDLQRRGLAEAARRRIRAAELLSVVYGRQAGSPLRERVRDLAVLVRSGPSWRAVLAQLAYTVAPGPVLRRRRAE